jgi:hypothetical protein
MMKRFLGIVILAALTALAGCDEFSGPFSGPFSGLGGPGGTASGNETGDSGGY